MKAPEKFDRSEDYLHEVACKISVLNDFGSGYREGLGVLLAAIRSDPRRAASWPGMRW